MKSFTVKTVGVVLVAVSLTACAQANEPEMPAVGAANPASVFCEQQGGKSVNRTDEQGNEYGVCVFADGREVDEWAYFRGEAQPNQPK